MIKVKEWNELSTEVRMKVAKVMFANDTEEKQEKMANEWHHNLDDEHRAMFKGITVKDNTIKVIVTI